MSDNLFGFLIYSLSLFFQLISSYWGPFLLVDKFITFVSSQFFPLPTVYFYSLPFIPTPSHYFQNFLHSIRLLSTLIPCHFFPLYSISSNSYIQQTTYIHSIPLFPLYSIPFHSTHSIYTQKEQSLNLFWHLPVLLIFSNSRAFSSFSFF